MLEKLFYLCDGEVPECRKKGCYKNGGECKHTSNIKHAINFRKGVAGKSYYEKETVHCKEYSKTEVEVKLYADNGVVEEKAKSHNDYIYFD